MSSRTRVGIRVACFAGGGGLLALLIARLGPTEIAAELTGAGAGVLWLFAAYAAGTSVVALPWGYLLPRPARPPLAAVIASRFAASGANVALPLFGVGGELCRLAWVDAAGRAAAVAAIAVDRLLYTAASAVFLLSGTVALALVWPGAGYAWVGAAVAGSLLLSVGVGVRLLSRHRIGARVERVLERLSRRSAGTFGVDVDERIAGAFARGPGPLAGGIGVHLVGRVLLGAEIYAGFLVLGVPLSPIEALVFASLPVALSFAGALIPGQLGILEGAQAVLAVTLGVSPAAAVSVVLLVRARQVASVALAWWLMARKARLAPPPGKIRDQTP
jgi:hypothetical protein